MATQSDFVATIDARLVSGSEDCGMGLTYRNGLNSSLTTTNDYVFYVHNDGRWGFDIIHSPDPGIAQEGVTDAIVPRALNRLAVLAQGDTFTFFVNGKYVGQAQDDTLARGKVGAAVWMLGPGGCEVEFDNFQVRVPPASAESQGKEILTDWTAANPHGWTTGDFAAGDATGSREIVDTKYRWEFAGASDMEAFAAPEMEPARDFDVSVDAQQLSGSQKTKYGLWVRGKEPGDGYMFGITGFGAYSVSYYQDGDYNVLSFPTPSDSVKPGEVNRLRVVGEGGHFTFYVNGDLVTEIDDETLAQGIVGVLAEAYDEDSPGATFEFSNFSLREVGEAGTAASPSVNATPAATATATVTPTGMADTSGATASCGPILTLEDEGIEHVLPRETPMYKSNPPTSGTHHPEWHQFGIYGEPIDITKEVHNLEHGYVIMHYNGIREDEVYELGLILRSDFRKVILAPYPNMAHKITLTAWNHMQVCTAVDEAAIRAFVARFRDNGPEDAP
jgi:hypothetical protein